MKLSDLELDVMHYFWLHSPRSAKQVHQEICQQRPLAYNTVKTIIDRLEEKGAIARSGKDGRMFLYQAIVSRQDLTPSAVPSFIQRFFGGSTSGLLTHLINDDKLSDADIEYLEEFLKDKKEQKANNVK